MHSVVLTEDGEVYVWGRNDQAQLGDSPHAALAEPTLMSALHGKSIIGIACGPSQVSNFSGETLGVCLFSLFFSLLKLFHYVELKVKVFGRLSGLIFFIWY